MKEFARDYFELLNGEFAGINLTRINNFDEFYNKQILDSILPLEQSNEFLKSLSNKKYVVDVGFGGGFPILPLAKMRPDNIFIGVETRKKKADVVRKIAAMLGLKNVFFLHARIENVLIDIDCTITFKAVGKVNDFLSKINTSLATEVYFYKGPGYHELEQDQILKAKKDWDNFCEDELQIPGTDKRFLIGFKNKSVPRGTTDIKQLVKVSDIK